MQLSQLLFGLVATGIAPALALYSSRDTVIQATASNFKDVVMDTEHAVMVEFFAPWCGHCKNLAPEYKKAADSLKGLAKLVAVDCDAESNKPLCGQYQVQGFPTLKVFGKNKKSPQDYQGERKAKAIVDFMIPQIPNYVQLIGTKGKAKSLEEFVLQEPTIPKAVLISKKSSTSPLLKAISTEYNKRLIVGELRTSEKEILAKVEEQKKFASYPVLVVLPVGVTSVDGVIVYEGDLKSAPLTAFLDKYAIEKPKKAKKEDKKPKKDQKKKADKKSSKEAEEEKAPEPFDPKVPEIVDQATLDSLCVEKAGVCVIAVSTLESEFEESVSAHKADLAIIEKLKKKFHDKKSPFHFTWLNPLRDPKPYLLTQFDTPDSIHRGGFDESSIESFLDDVTMKKEKKVEKDEL
ncbi:thioredoxin-domain-containing protein [Rhizoclosmatium globosum]|uniref:protein disulfide-isomerase n=1 Tax=Rhizoclosmatium globosum TaxID=329046 RepID=A0A1Y2CUK4_9FUNG|nr:thioredoxin-domain-containing protein [Rhizoclosmatium globosum]|eukprot:ORY49995.1 thioredoxin-domain-containing protein [Rhizoclosmatium globosum]